VDLGSFLLRVIPYQVAISTISKSFNRQHCLAVMGCDSFRHAVTENLGTDFKILLWIPFLLNSISVFWFLPREGYSVSKGQKFTLNAHLRPFLDFKTEIIYIFGENVTPAEKTVFPWKTGLKNISKRNFLVSISVHLPPVMMTESFLPEWTLLGNSSYFFYHHFRRNGLKYSKICHILTRNWNFWVSSLKITIDMLYTAGKQILCRI